MESHLHSFKSVQSIHNVDRYIQGDLDSVDLDELYDLGTPALPALLRYAEYCEQENGVDIKKYVINDTVDRSEIKDDVAYFSALYIGAFKRDLENKKPFTAFSVPDFKAKSALEEYLKD